MEPVSFTVGIVGLVGTFTACVDCFDYIRVGRRLGFDYETLVIKLDVIRLRFTRWGKAVGMGQGDENLVTAQLKDTIAASDEDFETIKRILGQILNLFARSAETSNRLALKSPKNHVVVAEDTHLENATIRNLHENMRILAIQRQKQSTISQKISWSLYRKRDIEGLIEDLTELVSALIELAPANLQQELCNTELANMDSDQNLVVLDDVLCDPIGDENAEIDDMLHKCVAETIERRKGAVTTAVWKRSRAGNGSKIRQGDNISSNYQGEIVDREGNYVVEDSELGKNVDFHQGHNYGGSV